MSTYHFKPNPNRMASLRQRIRERIQRELRFGEDDVEIAGAWELESRPRPLRVAR